MRCQPSFEGGALTAAALYRSRPAFQKLMLEYLAFKSVFTRLQQSSNSPKSASEVVGCWSCARKLLTADSNVAFFSSCFLMSCTAMAHTRLGYLRLVQGHTKGSE
eukprot:GHUV01046151.1.p1 GENE.GHUV01046151.1~~GHUV01046151.1.p1  ORF type:complete len:105 (-),score=21.12 GHUV01046151.1:81-395(-)